MHIIAGLYRKHKLHAPKTGKFVRPTQSRFREAFFNICQNYIKGADFLDLFSGTGAMGLEAISRGATSATFIDRDTRYITTNINNLNVSDHATIIKKDVLQAISSLTTSFDIIFLDPPYGGSWASKVINLCDKKPTILKENGILFVEFDNYKELEKEPLENLKLVKVRHYGRSNLLEYHHNIA